MKKFTLVINLLFVFIPLAFYFHLTENHTWSFMACALGILPLAAMMGQATEALASRAGAGVGAFT